MGANQERLAGTRRMELSRSKLGNAKKIVNANDNFAHEEFALAA